MSAVSEVKTLTNIRDYMTAGLKGIQKEQLRIKKEIQETREVLKDTFGKKWSIKLQSIELLRHMREIAKEIGLLRKQLARMLQGLKTTKIDSRTSICKMRFTAMDFNINNRVFKNKAYTQKERKLEDESPIDNIINYVREKDSLKEAKTNIKSFAKTAVKIPVSIAVWPIRKAISMIKILAKHALAIAAIAIFKKLPGSIFKLSSLLEVYKTAQKIKAIFEIIGRFSKNNLNIKPKFSGFKDIKGRVTGGLKSAGSAILGFVKTGLFAVANVAAKGIGEAVKSGAELENQNLYMDQAINSVNPAMGDKERKRYMKQLRDSAANTGMASGDVVAAGTKAISITGGDTKEAMELVKVAQDMSAMNPGKSVAEAMEALEAAKGGDISWLEGFGAKIVAADISNLGFKGAVQQKLKPQYSGGAEKLSGTGAGMVSIIKGKLNNKLQDMGLGIIEKLKPALESVIELIDRYSPALDAFGRGIASGIGFAVEWVQKIAGSISEKFGWIGEKSVFLKEVFMVSWGGIQNSLAAAWEFMQPVIGLIANGAMLLFNIFQWAFPGIQAVIENVWEFVKPIFEGIGTFIGWVADGVGALAGQIRKKNDLSSGGSEGGDGGGAGAFTDISEVKQNTMQANFVNQLKALEAQTPTNTKVQYSNSYAIPKGYELTQKMPGYSGETIMNPQVTVNINGVSLSTQEIVSKLVPQLRLALQNISSKTNSRTRLGGMPI